MNFTDCKNFQEEIKVHSGSGTTKVVIRITCEARKSYFESSSRVRIYTRTLILDKELKVKRVFDDQASSFWMTDMDRAKRMADRYGSRVGQRIEIRYNSSEEFRRAVRELEESLRPRPAPTIPRPRRTGTGAAVGAAIGILLGAAIGAATED